VNRLRCESARPAALKLLAAQAATVAAAAAADSGVGRAVGSGCMGYDGEHCPSLASLRLHTFWVGLLLSMNASHTSFENLLMYIFESSTFILALSSDVLAE